MSDVLQFSNVTVRRGGRPIVDKLNWQVSSGERWVILGPNGAGKTTLIQLAAARLFPTSGQVSILGETVGEISLADLHPVIGLASAAMDARLEGRFTVLDIVQAAAYGYTTRWREEYEEEDEQRARELLAALRIEHLAERRWGTLSSGERKRVGIARALMPNPELLALDEPAAGLDLGGREELLASLTQLAGQDYAPAMVLVTHHVEEIPAGFTHALLMKDGAVSSSGPIDEVLTSQHLSACFDLPLDVSRSGDRYTARASR
ncbi:MAG: ATP-binding cassette domain-containing protein [Flaviflexus sp.]|nr:ATP-binding cassette domain-containing protein [Flaviflexus sp.]